MRRRPTSSPVLERARASVPLFAVVGSEGEADGARPDGGGGGCTIRESCPVEAESVRNTALVEQVAGEGFDGEPADVHSGTKVHFGVAGDADQRAVGQSLVELRGPLANVAETGADKTVRARAHRELVIGVEGPAP